LHFTKQWIAKHGQVESSVLDWLKSHGGFCDCEVLANAADHWEQSRWLPGCRSTLRSSGRRSRPL